MTSLTVVRREVNAEFTRHVTSLNAGGKQALKSIFDQTLAPFHKRGRRSKPKPVDVWANKKFRSFILRETGKIAKETNRLAKGKPASGQVVNKAAVKVMSKTQRVCRVLISRGKLDFVIGTWHGEVCEGYLLSQT